MARERLSEPGFKITYTHPDEVPLILIDKDAMLQVFHNLVDNAIKYSGNSKLVEVSLHVKSDELQVNVQDHGIGIPKRDQEKSDKHFVKGQARFIGY